MNQLNATSEDGARWFELPVILRGTQVTTLTFHAALPIFFFGCTNA
jgi:hypothetical protein